MKVQPALLSIAAVIVAAMLGADSPGAEQISALSPQALQEIARVEVEIDCIECKRSSGWQFRWIIRPSKSNCSVN